MLDYAPRMSLIAETFEQLRATLLVNRFLVNHENALLWTTGPMQLLIASEKCVESRDVLCEVMLHGIPLTGAIEEMLFIDHFGKQSNSVVASKQIKRIGQ